MSTTHGTGTGGEGTRLPIWFPLHLLLYLHLISPSYHVRYDGRVSAAVDRLDFLGQLLESRFDGGTTGDLL